MMTKVSILLVESRTLMREGIKRLLNDECFDVVQESSDLGEACELLEQNVLSIDLILFDFNIDTPIEHKEEMVARLRKIQSSIRIIALSDTMCMDRLTRAVNAGVDGFLLRDISPSALRQSIHLVMLGEKVFPTGLAIWLAKRMPNFDVDERAPLSLSKNLSNRELEILQGVMAGQPNKQIANNLGITEGTVKVHLKGILKKINVRNRTQAAVWALNHGLPAEKGPVSA